MSSTLRKAAIADLIRMVTRSRLLDRMPRPKVKTPAVCVPICPSIAINLNGRVFVAWVVIALLYYFIAELGTTTTIGKGLMGLKVITISGRPLGAPPVLLRTLGRIVDVLPVFYLAGWIAMHGSRRPPERIGDRIAGTTVVPADTA
jgi:uncharacterized RDD family membrane protein YckC